MTTLELERSVAFKTILAATDLTDTSEHTLQYAAAITEANEAELFVLHAMRAEPWLEVPLDPLRVSANHEFCSGKVKLRKLTSGEPFNHLHHEEILDRGSVPNVVLNVIREKKIDLLIVGTHGSRGLKKLVLGSVAEQLFRCAPCPVLTVGPSATRGKQISSVLFVTDFGPASLQALPYAIDFANKTGGELILLHLAPPPHVEYVGPQWYPGTDELERREVAAKHSKLRALLPSNSGLKCNVQHVVEVHLPAEGIIDFATRHSVDLIVMGIKQSNASAPGRASHMPWAIAHEVVCSARCPVLTVKA